MNSLTVTQNTQSGGGTSQTRTYIYDMLGRLTQEANPETGTTNYFYDSDGTCGTSNGDLVKRVDAVQNVTCYAYDALHRVTAITYPSGSYSTNTDKKNFVYDVNSASGFTLSNTKGRLAEAYTCPPSGSCTTKKTDLVFSYSARGEVTDTWESTPHSSGYYHLTASYFPQGGLNDLSTGVTGMPILYYGGNSDPSGLDGEGRITKVTASSGQNPVTGVTYTTSGTAQPIGSLTQVTYGSQDRDNFSYDTGTGRMNQYKFSVGATPQTVTGNLGWNANGTLASLGITDQLNSSNSQSCTYSYDDLARIAGAHCGTVWYQDFSFDPFGNITKNANGGTSFLPTYSLTTNQFLSIPGCTPAFDANGFPTNDCDHTYTWDAAGNPLSVDAVTVTYDALGRLVEELVGSTYTQTLYGPTGNKLALTQGQTLLKALVPLPLGGQAVYKLVSGQPALSHYRHPDWLGSARLSSTPTQTLYYDVAYAPYGENYGGSGSAVALTFTGQTQDTVAGLYDFLYRRYNPNHGRWPMPDPAGLGAVSM